jgi:hypothetical protein
VKPKVYRESPRNWMWRCAYTWGQTNTATSHAAAFTGAYNHARSMLHQIRAALLDRARRAGEGG